MNLVLIISIVLIGRWGLVQSLKQCPFPGIPFNGLAWNDRNESITWENRSYIFQEGQQVRYYCSGQLDSLAGEIHCQNNGTWDGSVPLCERQVNVKSFGYHQSDDSYPSFNQTNPCKISSDISKHFYVQADFPDELEYFNIAIEKCSNESISSVTTGNREPPQGNVTVCTAMNAPENSLFHCRRNWIRNRELIYIDLTEVGTIKAVSIYTQDCGWPPVPVNGYVVSPVSNGSKLVEYQCNNSYKLNGNVNVTCDVATGRWDPLPKCNCSLPDLHPSVERQQINDTHFAFSCRNPQQLMVGPSERTCEQLNDPLGVLPYCTCPLPKNDYVRFTSINETGCVYACNESLNLAGNGFINYNQESQVWSTPTCQCKPPKTENGTELACNFPYSISEGRCDTTNGSWTELPKCSISATWIVIITILVLLAAVTVGYLAKKAC